MDKLSRTMSFPSIGDVFFVKKKGVRRVSIVLKPFKGVVVSMPYSFKYEDAERFVAQKLEWIAMAKSKMAKLETRKTIFDETSQFKTRTRELTFVRSAASESTIAVRISKTEIRVTVPEGVDIEREEVQGVTVKAIEKAWTLEAKELLPQRVAQLASTYGLSYAGLSLKKIKSRWGSCSFQNNINLSIYLMQLPDYLIDYVILHELCHTIEKNHGPKFWALLDKYTGFKAKQLAKEMKKYSTRYF